MFNVAIESKLGQVQTEYHGSPLVCLQTFANLLAGLLPGAKTRVQYGVTRGRERKELFLGSEPLAFSLEVLLSISPLYLSTLGHHLNQPLCLSLMSVLSLSPSFRGDSRPLL